MKKILILGGSHRDIPLIKASKELGYYVITLGNRDYYLGHKYSDKFYTTDFKDINRVNEIIKNEKIDYLLPGCGEESYLYTVRLSEELNIGNYDDLKTATLIHNKWKFKEFCLKNNISTPKGFFYKNNDDLKKLVYPIVVKPTDLSGGKGVKTVFTHAELEKALTVAKKCSSEVFLEEFIDGELIAYSIFLQNQRIAYSFIGKDDTYLNKYLVSSAYPIVIDNKTLTKLEHDIEKLAKLLTLVNGMFHLQILIKNGIPYIIDVTRRIPGDLYPYLIEYCDNIEYTKAVVNSYISDKAHHEFQIKTKQQFIIRHCIMSSKNGQLKNIYIDSSLKDKIVYRLDLMQEGDEIKKFMNDLIAIVFIKLEQFDFNIVENINQLIYPKVDSL